MTLKTATICIRYELPGANKESNWLPAPADDFNLTIRIYSPGMEAIDGRWEPPAVQKVQ